MGNVVAIVVDSNVPAFSPEILSWGTSWEEMNSSQQQAWGYISTHGTKIFDGPADEHYLNAHYLSCVITSPGTCYMAYFKLSNTTVGNVVGFTQNMTRYFARLAERDYEGYAVYTENAQYSPTPSVSTYPAYIGAVPPAFVPFDNQQDAVDAVTALISKPITYRLTNCSAPGAPQYATSGSTVSVPLSVSAGYSFINPSTDIYVTNNGTVVPSTYSNGVVTFTMP